eukprot:GFUD01001742.1.p1 GENE.GFUD01001742.1~~GFUD01001742.1.p1  ORF type:complete len:961 (-),score=273.49 GFUD01001742.1:501-3383(-)
MSDSESDEKAEKYSNDNYKSPSKKKRQKKGEGEGVVKNYCFEISLAESNSEKFTEISFLDLVAKDDQRLRKLAAIAKTKNGEADAAKPENGGLDPYASDDDEKLKALAASFESKYAEKTKPKKPPATKKRKIHEYDDLGEGYDEDDPFIDNSECFDEVVPQEITTAHGGFYINTGALEFKSNQNAVFELSSDEDSAPEAKKNKKPKKDVVKKKVQFKDGKEMKKAKVINTDVKRRARIINTDKKIKGPKILNTDAKKMDKLKVDIKKIDVKKLELQKLEIQKLEKSDKSPPPKSPEKSIPKPPEIIDLEAQLEALSNSVDLSKSESNNMNMKTSTSFSKPVQSATKVSSSGSVGCKTMANSHTLKSDTKVPTTVKVTKVDPKPSPITNGSGSSGPKAGWQNQINFPTNLDVTISNVGNSNNTVTATASNAKEKEKSFPIAHPASSVSITKTSITSSVMVSKSSREPKKPTTSLPTSELPSISKAMDLSSPKVRTPSTTNSTIITPHSMYQHDPKNILSSAPSDMSSILGTTAAYFQQKMQQKAESPKPETKPMFSPPNKGYYTSPKADGGSVFTSPRSIPSIPSVTKAPSSLPQKVPPKESPSSTPTGKQGSDMSQQIGRQAAAALYQQMAQAKQSSQKTDTAPSSTSKIVPDQSKKISSSSGPAKLPTTPTAPAKPGPTPTSQVLTPDMTNSLLGIAQNMMNNLQQQQHQTLPQQPARPSQAVTTQQQQKPAYTQQYQQQAAPPQKKSSGYDISNLLNSQPIPSAQPNSLSPANRSSPTASQQQPVQPVRSQQPSASRSPVVSQNHTMSSAHSQQQVQQSARSSALSQQGQQTPRSPGLSQQSPQVARSPSLSQQQHPQAARSPSLSSQQQHPQGARSPALSQQQATQIGRSQQASQQQVSQASGSQAYSQQIPQLANLQQQLQQAAARSPTLSQQATQAALLQQYQQNYYMGGMGGYQ